MSSGSYFEGSLRSTALFALVSLEAWTTTAVLFISLKHVPLTGGLLENAYYPTICSVLPWLAGCMFWIRVRKRGRLGTLDGEAIRYCSMIINNVLGITYIVILILFQVLFWGIPKVNSR
jgi:hypothetical protein